MLLIIIYNIRRTDLCGERPRENPFVFAQAAQPNPRFPFRPANELPEIHRTAHRGRKSSFITECFEARPVRPRAAGKVDGSAPVWGSGALRFHSTDIRNHVRD